MGANNSVPKTAEFINPNTEANVITISQQVSNRIDDAQRQNNGSITAQTNQKPYVCNTCAKEKEKQAEKPKGPVLSAYQKKLLDIENYNFEQKLKELENAAYKPINFRKENNAELQSMESELLNCYKQYPGEPLQCYDNAKDYEKFVFEKHLKTILKHTQAAGDNANQQKN